MTTAASDASGNTVSCVDSFVSMSALRAAWNRLSGGVPFRRFEWCETWWRHYALSADRLLVLLVRDADGELIGIAPWYVDTSWSRGRVIRFLGSGEVCSDYGTILALPGREQAAARAIAAWLHGQGAGRWDLIRLDGVAEEDEACSALVEAMRGLTHSALRRPMVHSWRLTLPDTWEAYTANLSKSRRRKVRNLQRTFDSGRAHRRAAERPEDLSKGLQILRDLHQRRRESIGETGCFASARFDAFHSEIAGEFLQQGLLHLEWIEIEGKPAAVEYGFVSSSTVYAYQSGFDPDAISDYPGGLQLISSFRGAVESGRRYYDFLRGDEPYKAEWHADAVPLVEIRIAANHAAAYLRHAAWSAARTARDAARRAYRRLRRREPGSDQSAAELAAAAD